jgi:tRNA(Ile2) C34 agmatinyltransferase TiaS
MQHASREKASFQQHQENYLKGESMTTHVVAGSSQLVAHPCPFCGSTLTSHISDFERCQQCGRQFNQQTISSAPALARQKIEAEKGPRRAEHVQERGVGIEQEALADKKARQEH